MAEQPNELTLDLTAVIAGIEMPSVDKVVYLNPAVAVRVSQIKAALERATVNKQAEQVEELQAELDKALVEAEKFRFVFEIASAPRDVRENALATALESYPLEFDLMGRAKPNPAGDNLYKDLYWSLHIRRITGPGGASMVPTPEQVAQLRASLDDAAHNEIEEAMNELYGDAQNGYEALVQSHDFLSQR